MASEITEITSPTEAIPESVKTTTTPIRGDLCITIQDIITRWQPMGYRVVIKLPFIPNDYSPLFALRVTPYIPPAYQLVKDAKQSYLDNIESPFYPNPSKTGPTDVVTVTRYDVAPPLAQLAMAHRFWTGTLRYRIRCITSFVSQGYVMTGVIKGVTAQELHNDPYTSTGEGTDTLRDNNRMIPDLCKGARRIAFNNYVMTDVSMFRHVELDVPYEYPVPFQDLGDYIRNMDNLHNTYNWTNYRSAPDNFICVYPRGPISSASADATLSFEIDYAGGPDFRFSTQVGYSRLNRVDSNTKWPLYPLSYPKVAEK